MSDTPTTNGSSAPRDRKGWDGKLRIRRKGTNGEVSEATPPDSDHEDVPDDGEPPQQIDADEDLLEEFPHDETDIDLNHCRVASIPALHLERFPKVERLCLRQNHVEHLAPRP